MASHLEMEMNSCLTEMEHLQSKMMELQQTKKQQDVKEKEKTEQIEPNLEVMEKWLKSVVGERENTQKAKNLYKSLTKDTSPEKRKEIWKLRNIYYNDMRREWRSPVQEPLFQIQQHKAPDTASQFMIDFIEATHNLFQIQQKRIDELETVVAELNAKIE
jgi:hypothetical protein